jgi:hypothetical protein
VQKQTFSAEALGNEYATGVSRPAVLTTKAFLPHQRVTKWRVRMHKCQFCGYFLASEQMQRISLNMVGRPYNICIPCSEKYKRKGLWDSEKNDIDWKSLPCVDET